MRWGIALVAGGLFGAAIRLGDGEGGAIAWLVNVGGPWLCLAFAIGWLARDGGARLAAAALATGIVAKYAVQLGQDEISWPAAIERIFAWGATALVVGACLGWCGGRVRSGARSALVPLAALLAAEPIAFLSGALHGESAQLKFRWQAGALVVLAVELAIALGIGVGFLRRPEPA